ncbi:MAG: mucoidy inhibitor-like protein [Bacteroidetes bacterium]|nr:MAG: mucoidy inhibitor-like protein [Bacteroidota bacterium]
MKLYLTILLLNITLIVSASSIDKKVKSNIESVTVFQNGAQIYRTASAYLKKGHQIIRLSDLSTTINPQSIQVKGKGNFTIMSVTHQINYLKEIRKNKRIVSLMDSIELLTSKQQYQKQIVAAYGEEIQLLKSNMTLKGNNSKLTVNEIKAAADFYRARFREIYSDKLKINEKISKQQIEINKLTNALNLLQQRRAPKGVGEILVEINAKEQVSAKFTFDYLVNNAGWTPLYDIRAINVEKPIELHYRANIYQNTGVDWNNIKLSVSTGNPRQNGIIPTLNVWYLNYYNSQLKNKSLSYAVDDDLEVSAAPRSKAMTISQGSMNANNSANYTSVSQNQTNTIFKISLPYTIPSSNKRVNVKVQKWELPATYRYYAVPRIDPDAFLQARITGWEDLNLMAGSVNIFFEGTYVGKSYLNPSNLNDTLDISLGRDKSIVIERRKIKDKNSTAVFGGSKKMNVAWNISIRNNKKDAIHLVIKDQLPLSNRKDIEVRLLQSSGAQFDNKTGFLTWDMNIKSKQKKSLDFQYQIKYPKDYNISNIW